jgi:PHD/YefM family antitoxin component YafN of YafNO toxin-antitoxin module
MKFIGKKVIFMRNIITANDLKTKGVAAIDMVVRESEEVVVTVRGKSRYVVLSVEKYNYYRECELEAAIKEAKRDYEEGRFVAETVEEHIKRVTNA